MKRSAWWREGVLIAAASATGWWAHGGAAVHASSAPVGELSFQFVKSDLNNALTVYDSGQRVLYVYQGASATGAATVNCSYMFHIARAGAAIQRENCQL
ncbi:MAG TPA: hypothetical protein VGM11_06215 [Acidobacteriaceae bacterium]|jgi:hypothetical protein